MIMKVKAKSEGLISVPQQRGKTVALILSELFLFY